MFRTMGNATTVNSTQDSGEGRSSNENYDQPLKRNPSGKQIHLKFDVPLLLLVFLLMIFGLLMVYSASYDVALEIQGDALYFIKRQAIFMVIGLVTLGILVFFDYHYWQRLALPIMLVTILALIAVLIFGQLNQGAVRTLVGKSVQPSELAKLTLVIYLSAWLFSKKDQLHQVSFGLIPLAMILGIVGGLIYRQPDLSAVITIMIIGGIMFFLAGGDLRQMLLLVVVALIAGWFVILVSNTGNARISGYLAGLEDPMQAPDHVRRSIEAFVNGGWFGLGIGKGQTKLTGLPVPHTDSIYAVIGEETGIFGSIGILILFSLLLWRGMTIARRAPDQFGTLMAAGLTLWLVFEGFINMAVMVNLLPFAGNALPFISYGGSNLLVSVVAIGILLNISRLSVKTKEESGRLFSEVVDLRWRNRGRRVSRSNRSGSPRRAA